MSKEKAGLKQHGPIATVMENLFGSPDDHKGDSGDLFDGVSGYPKGSGGDAPELTFVNNAAWGRTKPANFREE